MASCCEGIAVSRSPSSLPPCLPSSLQMQAWVRQMTVLHSAHRPLFLPLSLLFFFMVLCFFFFFFFFILLLQSLKGASALRTLGTPGLLRVRARLTVVGWRRRLLRLQCKFPLNFNLFASSLSLALSLSLPLSLSWGLGGKPPGFAPAPVFGAL